MSSQFGDYFIDILEYMFYNSFTLFDKFPPPAWDIMGQKESGGGRCMTPEEEALKIFRSLDMEEQIIYLDRLRALAKKRPPEPSPLEKGP